MTNAHLAFLRLVVAGDRAAIVRALANDATLATHALTTGATRANSSEFFFAEIAHHVYAGDTALHMAAAAFQRDMAMLLVAHGASCRARNRRGAEPLHYAADGNHNDPDAQAATLAYLLSAGADANTRDASGVTPLHRAVRTRSAAAVRVLLEGGADPRLPNGSGSTPLHLAVRTTGASGSGSPAAREHQREIVRLLLAHGASPHDRDGRGTTVLDAATSAEIRFLLSDVNAR